MSQRSLIKNGEITYERFSDVMCNKFDIVIYNQHNIMTSTSYWVGLRFCHQNSDALRMCSETLPAVLELL